MHKERPKTEYFLTYIFIFKVLVYKIQNYLFCLLIINLLRSIIFILFLFVSYSHRDIKGFFKTLEENIEKK